MGSETRVCPGLIGWVVVEEFAGMMYFFGLKHYIIVIDNVKYRKTQVTHPAICGGFRAG